MRRIKGDNVWDCDLVLTLFVKSSSGILSEMIRNGDVGIESDMGHVEESILFASHCAGRLVAEGMKAAGGDTRKNSHA